MKDVFNGNIKNEGSAIAILKFFSILMFIMGGFFFGVAFLYDKFGPGARELTFSLGVFSIVAGIIHPILAIYFVRRFDRYPRIAKLFFKEYMFTKNEK